MTANCHKSVLVSADEVLWETRARRASVAYAFLSAVLFGISPPLAKSLLGGTEPVMMASLLYLGSGLGLLIPHLIRHVHFEKSAREAGLDRHDVPWLLGAMLCGGVAAPIALMFGLTYTPASTSSLLLNFEGAATAAVAAVLFREAMSKRIWMAVIAITCAGILLSLDASGGWGFSPGAVCVPGACILWGVDNNLTRHISSKDPIPIIITKGIGAGIFSLILAFMMGSTIPGLKTTALSLLMGFCCYGLSILFFIHAMRVLGSARTGAFFACAPFVGVVVSFILFREFPTVIFMISLPVAILGAWLLVGEKHSHTHTHIEIEHDHMHDHNDPHHRHEHEKGEKAVHSHRHRHWSVTHEHSHMPDIHHRHEHGKA